MEKKRNKLKSQKRVIKLKRRTNNIGGYRKNKNYIRIKAIKNYRITEEQIKSIKIDLLSPKGLTGGKLSKVHKMYFLMVPNKVLTSKGILMRMGGGKAKVKQKVLYITKGYTCIELVSNITNYNKAIVSKLLKKFTFKYTFFTYEYLI